jgi:hypothetical protein
MCKWASFSHLTCNDWEKPRTQGYHKGKDTKTVVLSIPRTASDRAWEIDEADRTYLTAL